MPSCGAFDGGALGCGALSGGELRSLSTPGGQLPSPLSAASKCSCNSLVSSMIRCHVLRSGGGVGILIPLLSTTTSGGGVNKYLLQ